MNRRDEKAYEHSKMADHHEAKAAGLEAQLERTVFSDDDNAIQALEARIAENEAKRDQMKLVNKLWAKKDASGLAAIGEDLERINAKLAKAGAYWGDKPHLPYELTNLGARIRSDRKRIEAQGIADFQKIVAQGLSDQYLRWKGIEATEKLANSTNAKVVIVGSGSDGLPIILGNQ